MTTDVHSAAAQRALVQMFFRERARFAKQYPRARTCVLMIRHARCILPEHCGLRQLAYAQPGMTPPRVVVHHRLLELPPENQLGILRHELGHISDPTPMRSGCEQRADDLAEKVTGQKIRYDPRDVQTVGTGTYPRPLYLHR